MRRAAQKQAAEVVQYAPLTEKDREFLRTIQEIVAGLPPKKQPLFMKWVVNSLRLFAESCEIDRKEAAARALEAEGNSA